MVLPCRGFVASVSTRSLPFLFFPSFFSPSFSSFFFTVSVGMLHACTRTKSTLFLSLVFPLSLRVVLARSHEFFVSRLTFISCVCVCVFVPCFFRVISPTPTTTPGACLWFSHVPRSSEKGEKVVLYHSKPPRQNKTNY